MPNDAPRTPAEAALAALASRYVDVAGIPWRQTGPGIQTKVLMHDPATGMLTILSRLEPGARIPEHTHQDLEQTFVLEGALMDHEGACTAGNFVIRPKGSRHSPVAPDGCLMLVFFLNGSQLAENPAYGLVREPQRA